MTNPTIKDVAELAGVSITTVSHVINDTRYVSDDLRKRVTEAMESLNYQPNILARSLRMGKTKTIGLIVPDNSNLFFAEVARLIEDAGYENGYSVILCNTDDDPDKEAAYVKVLLAKQVDGVIFISTGGVSKGLQLLIDAKVPVVITDREIQDVTADVVLVDNYEGGYAAAKYLIQLGHQRIGCIAGPSRVAPSSHRLSGFLQAMNEAGLTVPLAYIEHGDFQFRSGETAMEKMMQLSPSPTAYFVCNDMMAIGAVRAAHNNNLRIPEDISIIGFDNIPISEAIFPALSTVAQPYQEISRLVTSQLLSRIEETAGRGKKKVPYQKIVLQPGLILRGSCSPATKDE